MQKYYCLPIKKYVCLVCRYIEGRFEVLFFGNTNGILLFTITMPFSSGKKRCAYINVKDYEWLYNWLIEKRIAIPTKQTLNVDNFVYPEFKFNKEI